MNIEKLIMLCMAGFLGWSGVYVAVSQPQPREFGRKRISTDLQRTDDFNLDSVIDNRPFTHYYLADKRNPFVPVLFSSPTENNGGPTEVKPINPDITFPWKFPKPKTDPKPDPKPDPEPPVYNNEDVPVVNLPGKPDETEPPPENKVTPAEDLGIPVSLIGFAKTEGEKERRAILANRKTGEVFTVTEGETVPSLEMKIITVTPFSIIMKMKNGEKVEFVNDILKEAHESNAESK